MGLKHLLHAGCGSKVNKPPHQFAAYVEHRLDANRNVDPEIVASIVAMPMIEDGDYDAVYCSHTLEHLYSHEVQMALSEFHRVLKPGGDLLIHVPDLQSIGGKIAMDQADNVLYTSCLGPVSPLDMLYGHRASVGAGNFFMAHKTGFTATVLKTALLAVGFWGVKVSREVQYELIATATKEVAHAGQERKAEALPQHEVRARLGEEARV